MKRILASAGALAVVALLSTPAAFADSHSSLVQSNTVKVTGGYDEAYTTQQYEQTGTTSQQVQVQTGGGYYGSRTVQTGSHQECTTTIVVTNHATQHGHWVNTGYWVQYGYGDPRNHWVDQGYWQDDGWGPPYYNTYDPVTTCNSVPDYTTQSYWVPPTYGYQWRTVPMYGWVNVTSHRWHVATVDNGN